MKLEKTYVFILAGGIGSRFWPMSREARPKQFLDILGTGETLIRQAFNRYHKLVDAERIFVITNRSYVSMVKEQLPELAEHQILGEPQGKNTAPCVAYAAHKVADIDKDATLIIAPSDHLILDEPTFFQQVIKARDFAASNHALITLGIRPHRPDTGYGYIQYEDEVSPGINRVKAFTEKPPLEMAKIFLDSGDFLWNSGMFVWSVSSILAALDEHLTETNLVFAEGQGAYNTNLETAAVDSIYQRIQGISIDHGVLEKAENVYVFALLLLGWSDLGTWKSVQEMLESGRGEPSREGRIDGS